MMSYSYSHVEVADAYLSKILLIKTLCKHKRFIMKAPLVGNPVPFAWQIFSFCQEGSLWYSKECNFPGLNSGPNSITVFALSEGDLLKKDP